RQRDGAIERVVHGDRLGRSGKGEDERKRKREARQRSGALPAHQNRTCAPTITSRPGMELPQAPFWLTRLAPHGEESRPMKIGWSLMSKMLFSAANSFTPLRTSTSPRMFQTQNGGLR